jgi:hypothetical protein
MLCDNVSVQPSRSDSLGGVDPWTPCRPGRTAEGRGGRPVESPRLGRRVRPRRWLCEKSEQWTSEIPGKARSGSDRLAVRFGGCWRLSCQWKGAQERGRGDIGTPPAMSSQMASRFMSGICRSCRRVPEHTAAEPFAVMETAGVRAISGAARRSSHARSAGSMTSRSPMASGVPATGFAAWSREPCRSHPRQFRGERPAAANRPTWPLFVGKPPRPTGINRTK